MRRRRFVLAAAAAAVPALLARAADAAGEGGITVFAAASLREAFEAAAPAFTTANGYPVRFSFGGSDTLATQVLQGAPADVFASADEAQMQRAVAGRAALAPRVFAHNHLVVVAPAGDARVRTIGDLAAPGVTLVLAAPAVPVGAYARRAFAALEGRPGYGRGFDARVRANVVSEETDVKAVATKVALGEADAGVVYATDVPALASKLRAISFPAGTAPVAAYPIAVTAAAPNAAGARAFVAFVLAPAGRRFLTERGFA